MVKYTGGEIIAKYLIKEDVKHIAGIPGRGNLAEGKVKTHVAKTVGLSEINQVFEELEKGTYTGRAIIDTSMT